MENKKVLKYKKEDLLEHIDKRKDNIKVFETAIQNERNEIKKELEMINIIEIHEKSV